MATAINTTNSSAALFLSQLQPNLTIPILPNGSVCSGGSLPFNLTIADSFNLTDPVKGPLYVYIEVRGTDLTAPPVRRGWMQLERRKGSSSSGGSKSGGSSSGSSGGSSSGSSSSGSSSGTGSSGSNAGSSGATKPGSSTGSTSGNTAGTKPGSSTGSTSGGTSKPGSGTTSSGSTSGGSTSNLQKGSMGSTTAPKTGSVPSVPPPPYSSLAGNSRSMPNWSPPPPYSVSQSRVTTSYVYNRYYNPYPIYTYSPFWYPLPVYTHYPYYYNQPPRPVQTIPADPSQITRSDQVYDALPLVPLADFYANATSSDIWSDSSYDDIPLELVGHVYTLRANFFYEKDVNSSTNDMPHVDSYYFGVSLCDSNGVPQRSSADNVNVKRVFVLLQVLAFLVLFC
ncbi:hypothetical protein BCR33DRAFT_724719 [Rhizoclosmatium globosum]|uniref:Uncharacterized protein n=1 Tax=Rhizoclosmatium globosum TaxID=329046 RepID=A0A1Y2B415_9FUNG|nr:hypothetical protein BCR33DRAFT_724719 [Rhizoclosmatium globosum]|eukprot:ORY29474.1 hypothetical protein BCR33DRAFT_724719 [Rhizoclosmatium globosum]